MTDFQFYILLSVMCTCFSHVADSVFGKGTLIAVSIVFLSIAVFELVGAK